MCAFHYFNTNQKFIPNRLTVLVLLALLGSSAAYAEPVVPKKEVKPGVLQSDAQPNLPKREIDNVVVEGQTDANTIGHNKVYSGNMSTVYRDKQQLENFQGTSPADIYTGVVGVFSGDARNSGALDTNIRGIQGQERVPVIVDGTKQAITVWRGYNGANNRNYIDPLLISNVQVEKGPSMSRDIQGSVGGAVVINTLNVDDILKPGQKWGIDLYGAWANNTTRQRDYKFADYVGKDWHQLPRDLFPAQPKFFPSMPDVPLFDYNHQDYLTWIEPKSKNGSLKLQDHTYRIAAAGETDYIDFLAAYAYRSRGNYFAGKNGWKGYSDPSMPDGDMRGYNFTRFMADMYRPGNEVFNTSYLAKSWLAKLKIKPTDKQSLEFGYRHTDSTFGDIMPSRVAHSSSFGMWSESGKKLLPQWPLSHVKQNAYNLEYQWQPDSRWIDVHANLWHTQDSSEFNSTGGWPLQPVYGLAKFLGGGTQAGNPQYGFCLPGDQDCIDKTQQHYEKLMMDYFQNAGGNLYKDVTMYSSSQLHSKNKRWGISASNKMRLSDRLNLTVGMAYQYEKLLSDSAWLDDPYGRTVRVGTSFGWFSWPRSGVRHEWETSALLDWQAIDNLDIGVGARYSRYSSEDLLVTERRAKHDPYFVDKRYVENGKVTDPKAWAPEQKAKGHGLSPMISASYRFNHDYSRIYARLARQVRMPTLFETTVGFSMVTLDGAAVKPERGTLFELGYVHDLRQWLPSARTADIKLAYYNNTVKDVIDRSDVDSQMLRATNFDKQKVSGLELQSRYDNGRFFADLSLGYMLKNEVCDANEARHATKQYKLARDIPSCVPNGFNGGYLQNMAPPRLTADLVLGSRFWGEKLEIGTRWHYHSKKINPNATEKTYGSKDLSGGAGGVWLYNVPMDWNPVTTVDAYLSYKLKDTATFTLAGTNLTNRYYVDPLARTLMPAPGRALRMSLNVKF